MPSVRREKTSQFHLVLRAPYSVRIGGKSYKLIEEHNRVVEEHGQALLAKFGVLPGHSRLERLRKQVKVGNETRVFLAFKRGGKFCGFSARIADLFEEEPPSELQRLIPVYYEEIQICGRLWLLLTEPLSPCSLRGLYLFSNGRDLVEVMSECRTSAMLVTYEKTA